MQFWNQNHYLVLRNLFSDPLVDEIKTWINELSNWPEMPGKWMKYFEKSLTTDERLLCRVENFVPYHNKLRSFICSKKLFATLGQLMGEEACLFKEKINFKYPGGSGFGAHQDAPAFTTFGQKYHITMMVSVDSATVENGCMEFSNPVPVYETLPQDPGGTLSKDLEAKLPWRPLETNAGDIIFFDSYIPHRSPPNNSMMSRRAMYITYNRRSEGNRRADYFAHKRLNFPPECERITGQDYSDFASLYNLGNPIR